MKPRETTVRLQRFEADEKSRKVADLELMIRDFEQMASDLERQIRAEEDRTGVRDAKHFAYSTFAKSAAQRREKLLSSAADLKAKLESAMRERDEAMDRLSRTGTSDSSDVRARNRSRMERGHSAPLR
jgi:predicted  nucleic acid-binding Zn-ribbon protein